ARTSSITRLMLARWARSPRRPPTTRGRSTTDGGQLEPSSRSRQTSGQAVPEVWRLRLQASLRAASRVKLLLQRAAGLGAFEQGGSLGQRGGRIAGFLQVDPGRAVGVSGLGVPVAQFLFVVGQFHHARAIETPAVGAVRVVADV